MQQSLFTEAPKITLPASLALDTDRFHPNGMTEHEIRCCFVDAHVSSKEKTEPWYLDQNEFWFWDRLMESGKSYMVGDMPMAQYLKKYSSPLSDWQKRAYKWALDNPGKILIVETKTHEWRVYSRGEYVEFALPYHEKGGERNYATRNGKTKVLVNED